MDLDLIYKIVCEKGMNIEIRPAVMMHTDYMGYRDTIFIVLTKGKKKMGAMFPIKDLSTIYNDPQSVLKERIDKMIETLEEETDDGSV